MSNTDEVSEETDKMGSFSQSPKRTDLPGMQTHKICKLDKWKVKPMTSDDFKHLCKVFGCDCNSTANPSPGDMKAFLELFTDFDCTTVDGFKSLLEEFKLKEIIECDEEVDLLVNVNCFGWIIRSLTGVRFCAIDGQHR